MCKGIHADVMVRRPFIRPADLRPATARATISIFDDVATPQSNEPSSNTKKKTRNVH